MFYQKCPRRDHSSHQSTQLSQLRFGIIFFHRSISQPQQCSHLGGITLCGGGCPRPCRMLTASLASIHQTPLAPPPPGWNNQKCLYILPNVRGRGQNTTPHLENDSSRLWILHGPKATASLGRFARNIQPRPHPRPPEAESAV